MANTLQLRVVSPDKTVIDRKVRAVSFMGVDGSFGILPNHAPLITATVPGIVDITYEDGQQEQLLISQGSAEMHNNVLSLITEAGERAVEIDLERARAAEERARKRIAEGPKIDINLARAEAALQKAMLRQMLARRKGGTGTVG